MKSALLAAVLPALMLSSCVTPPTPLSDKTQFFPFENSRLFTEDGYLLHYRIWEAEHAKGSALLVHGLGGATYSYRYIAPALAEAGYNVFAVDLPGFGYSSRTRSTSFDSDEIIAVLWRLVDSLTVSGRWVLVGHSMGGRTVLAMEAGRPDVVSGLILIDPALELGGASRLLVRIPPGNWILRRYLERSVLTYDGVENLLLQAYGRFPTDTEVRNHLEPLLIQGTVGSVAALARNTRKFKRDLSTVSVPTLLLWGEDDPYVPAARGLEIAAMVPSSTLVVVEGAAHCLMETHADAGLDAIFAFLSAVR